MLHLVAAHGNLVRLEHEDVRSHQHGVHEQARRDIGVRVVARRHVLVDRCLVGVSAIEQTLARHARQQPRELRDLGDVRLPVEENAVRVQPRGQPACRDFQRGTLNARRLVALDQRVVIGKEIKILSARAAARLNGRANGADVVAQVRRTGGGDAREKARDRSRTHGRNKEVKGVSRKSSDT